MKRLLIGTLSFASLALGIGSSSVLAQNELSNLVEYLVRDGITWYLANPVSTRTSVLFNIYAHHKKENTALSLIVEGECTNEKRLIVKSERFYLANGGFTQKDEEVVYTDLVEDSPFGMAVNIVCSNYYQADSETIVISNKNETLGDTISTNNFIKGCTQRSIHSCPL
jgi:hypothetical protein